MEIKRIDAYDDSRFSERVLKQHGAFEADSLLYEVEIISDSEAIVRGPDRYLRAVVEEFRYYAEHITRFYNEKMERVAEYPPVAVFELEIGQIQPSQFYVDAEKKRALAEFITEPGNVIIPVMKRDAGFISLDGHTRLSIAADRGFGTVKGFLADGGSWAERFAGEARKRGVRTPYDMQVLDHAEYEVKWNRFCEEFLSGTREQVLVP